ncbi:MAG: DUF1801 domain-containing protein [Bacteroidetes bacterium]|nr:DUF1801 domain-containing protein [Bacteroidota bacterium]
MDKLFRFTSKDFQAISLEDWLNSKPKELHSIAITWFDEIRNCGPDVEMIFHDGHPTGCVENTPFAYLDVFTAHANVGFFYGAFFYDEHQLLEGTGKRMRHIKIKPALPIEAKYLKAFLKTAYLDIKKRLNES